MKVGLAYSTKDRCELSQQSIEPLLHDRIALHWIDGSLTKEGEELPFKHKGVKQVHSNVRGGADLAIVYGLTALLNHPDNYDVVGLAENDVLVHPDWVGSTLALFERGKAEGLEVGAVSPRCYEDRILLTCDGFSICHNLGAGFILFTRAAARLVLDNFRTGWWPDNRAIFAQLSGLDIGRYAAFRMNEQGCTADWWFDAVLASHGFASLALTPSPVEMIGQVPPLRDQGLTLATQPLELLRNDKAFDRFVERTAAIREGTLSLGIPTERHLAHDGLWTIFPHQLARMGATWSGDWELKWSQGFGPFAWRAGSIQLDGYSERLPTLTIPVIGACTLLVGGGPKGATVRLFDEGTGQTMETQLLPDTNNQAMSLLVPPVMDLRNIRLTALTEGATVYGLQTKQAQPWLPHVRFDHASLPPP